MCDVASDLLIRLGRNSRALQGRGENLGVTEPSGAAAQKNGGRKEERETKAHLIGDKGFASMGALGLIPL